MLGLRKRYSGTYHWRINGDWALSAGERLGEEWVDVSAEGLFADTSLLASRLGEEGVPVETVWFDDGVCRFTPADRDANQRTEKKRVKRVLKKFYGKYQGRRIRWSYFVHQYN